MSSKLGWKKIWSRHKGCNCKALHRHTQHCWDESVQFNHGKEPMIQGWTGHDLKTISHNAKNNGCDLSDLSAEAVKPFHRVKLNQKNNRRDCISKSRRLARSQLSLLKGFPGSNVASQGMSQCPDGGLEIESSRSPHKRNPEWKQRMGLFGHRAHHKENLWGLLMKKLWKLPL